MHMGGCQNYGPFWVLIIIRHLLFRVPGTIILTTTHIFSGPRNLASQILNQWRHALLSSPDKMETCITGHINHTVKLCFYSVLFKAHGWRAFSYLDNLVAKSTVASRRNPNRPAPKDKSKVPLSHGRRVPSALCGPAVVVPG